MPEDWGASANAPSFSLFKDTSPEDEAKKDGLVDGSVYNRWKKAERRLYQRLKTKRIAELLEKQKDAMLDDLSKTMEQLTFLRNNAEEDSGLDDLIKKVSDMQVSAKSNPQRNNR